MSLARSSASPPTAEGINPAVVHDLRGAGTQHLPPVILRAPTRTAHRHPFRRQPDEIEAAVVRQVRDRENAEPRGQGQRTEPSRPFAQPGPSTRPPRRDEVRAAVVVQVSDPQARGPRIVQRPGAEARRVPREPVVPVGEPHQFAVASQGDEVERAVAVGVCDRDGRHAV
jgi:hypothetical protein